MENSQNKPDITGAEWEAVKELVYQWETEHPVDLEAWLKDKCHTDSTRREVERLVGAAAKSGDFMRSKAAEEQFGVDAQHPTRISRYQIIQELGAGGLGIVYAAFDPSLERKVAIKVLRDKVSPGPDRQKRLRWDAKAASTVKHPGIVVIYDIGMEAGSDFIVMECVEGETLGKRIAQGPIAPQPALEYAIQIAEALEAAHKAGIIHRDLKPNNIMITGEGAVRLLDFGLARHDDPDVEHTSLPSTIEGHFAGTVSYVSPEQAEGRKVDNRGDIFAFGCIFYEMLTGQKAFEGNSAISLLGNILHQNAPTLRQKLPELCEQFDQILDRCLKKDPSERFGSISEVIPLLRELVVQPDAPLGSSLFKWRGWNRWSFAVSLALMLALLVTAGILLLRTQAHTSYPRIDQIRVTNDAGLASFPTVSREGTLIAYASDRAEKGNLDIWVQHWDQQDAKRLTSDPQDDTDPSFNPDSTELIYRSEKDGGGLYRVSTLGGDPVPMAPGGRDGKYSPDGQWIAYWTGYVGGGLKTGSASIHLIPARGGQPEDLLKDFDVAAFPVWSATGSELIFLGRKAGDKSGEWWVLDMNDHTTYRTQVLKTYYAGEPARSYYPEPRVWLPDHEVLFTARNRDATNIYAVGIDTRGKVFDEAHHWTDGTDVEDYPDAASTPKSTYAVYAALKESTAICRLRLGANGQVTGEPEILISGLPVLGSPSISRDASKLMFGTGEPSNDTIELADFGPQGVGAFSPVRVSKRILRPILSGDGKWLTWYQNSKGYIMPVKGSDPVEVCGPCTLPSDISFDGSKAIFENRYDELLLCIRGQKPRPLFHFAKGDWTGSGGRFSPDEHWIAFSGQHPGKIEKQILIAPFTADGLVREGDLIEISTSKSSNIEPVWSPDGRRVYFLSDRDGSVCIWARDLDWTTKRPVGEEYTVAHFDHAGLTVHGPGPSPQTIGLSASSSFLLVTLSQTSGNIWAREVRH